MLTKELIKELLEKLDEKLQKRGLRGEVCIFGGAAMILNFNSRDSTKDVDAIFAPKSEFYECVKELSEEFSLPPDWLNDGVKGFLTDNFTTKEIYKFNNLTVYTPEPGYLLAMKAMSSRVDSMDKEDIMTIIKALNLSSINEVFEIVSHYYPKNTISAKTQFFLEETFDEL